MGWIKPTEWQWEQLAFPCHTCKARRDEWCITKSGNASQMLHADRYHQALKAKRKEAKRRKR